MRHTLVKRAANGAANGARTGTPRDPWARRDAWRYEGVFARRTVYKNLWPGFSYGVGAFALYCIGEQVLGTGSHDHEDGHEQDSH